MNSSRTDLVIAIDGPAGAGKSTVSKLISQKTGLPLLDTGAMYRCVALTCVEQEVDFENEQLCQEIAEKIEISFEAGSPQKVFANGREVTDAIRTPETSQAASKVSVISGVRRALVAKQKEFVNRGGLVLEGRDVTTVVAPNAQVKVFLTASIEERARRRWLELKQKGSELSLNYIVHEVIERDYRDYTRDDSPLCLAETAVIVESFGRTPEEIADQIIALAP